MYIESHSEIINDNQGRPDSILYVIRDITQRKETEKAIRENEERFVTIFQEVPDPVLIFRQDGTILDMNRQCEEWFDVGKICSLGHKVQNLGFSPLMPITRISFKILSCSLEKSMRPVSGLQTVRSGMLSSQPGTSPSREISQFYCSSMISTALPGLIKH